LATAFKKLIFAVRRVLPLRHLNKKQPS